MQQIPLPAHRRARKHNTAHTTRVLQKTSAEEGWFFIQKPGSLAAASKKDAAGAASPEEFIPSYGVVLTVLTVAVSDGKPCPVAKKL